MRMNDFDEKNLSDTKAEAIFEGLLQESETRFSFERLVEQNVNVPELSRYRYIFFSGRHFSEGKDETKTVELDYGEINADGSKALTEGKAAGNLACKVEFLLHVKLLDQAKNLRTVKKSIEGQLNQVLELQVQIEHKAKSDAAFLGKVKECETKVKELTTFVGATRTAIVEAEAVDKENDEELNRQFPIVSKVLEAAKAHNEGMKHFLKDLRNITK